MTEKKPYSPPQIFEVELNQEQAILAVCSTTATTISDRGTKNCSGSGGNNCRRFTSGGNAGGQPS